VSKNNPFQKAIEALNEKQRKAVNKLEGPMILLAGPGTGKTHVLAARVGQILRTTDTGAEHILCLTYTDAGAHAMRSRLLDWIGPEAHKVTISTFHAFCNNIIQEHSALFGHYDLQPVTELERIKIIRQVIDNLDKDHLLRKNNLFRYVNEKGLSVLFKLIKQEGWTFDYIRSGVYKYLESLKDNPDFVYKRKTGTHQKGDLKVDRIEKEAKKMERLLALSSCYDDFVDLMNASNRYEYDDMILWVLKAFEEDKHLLSSYQEKYLYFLVDEYQDTNGAQEKLLQLLSGYWDQPNLFVVGDDDQAIYEFQGAKLDNLIDLYKRFEGQIEIMALKNNYRSNQKILDASFQLIGHNSERAVNLIQSVDLDKQLKASLPERQSDQDVLRIHKYPNSVQENIGVFNQVKNLIEKGVEPAEIAIIYTQHKYGEPIRMLMQQEQIPYQSKRKINVLTEANIIQIRSELIFFKERIHSPHKAQEMLPGILIHPHWGVSMDDVRVLIELNKTMLNEHGMLAYNKLKEYVKSNPEDFVEQEGILEAIDRIERIEDELRNGHLLNFVMRFLQESQWVSFILDGLESQWNFNVLNSFWSYVKESIEGNPRLDLSGLLDTLDELDANGLSIDYIKVEFAEDGVNLLTAHGAKGLEFSYVFIINCTDDAWEKSRQVGGYFSIPSELYQDSSIVDLERQSDQVYKTESKRRLFYVAMTRAKKQLTFSFASKNLKEKNQTLSRFLSEIIADQNLTVEDKKVSKDQINAFVQAEMLGVDQNLLRLFDLNWVQKQLSDLKLSASSLRAYLECKRTFFFEYVLGLTSIPNIHAVFGQVAHETLNRLLNFIGEDKTELSFELIKNTFEQVAAKSRYLLNDKLFEDMLNKGFDLIPEFWRYTSEKVDEKSRGEVPLKAHLNERIPIYGKIDRIDFVGRDHLRVVDYKSSRKTAKLKKAKGEDFGGIYWFQLLFYRVLVEEAGLLKSSSVELVIEYLDLDEKSGKSKFESDVLSFKEEEVGWMHNLIESTYDQILIDDFNTKCNDPSCKWCGLKLEHDDTQNIFQSEFKDSFDES
jgi:DNA helicase-2/ATP-dependent DNA helicase PcrA